MTVIIKCSAGWLLCHNNSSHSNSNNSHGHFRLKNELFNILTPFLMDSAAQKISQEMLSPTLHSKEMTKRNKRKRKLQEQMNSSSTAPDEEFIIQSFQRVMKLQQESKFFDETPISALDWLENNHSARGCAQKLDSGIDFLNITEKLSSSCEINHQVLCSKDDEIEMAGLVESNNPVPLVVTFKGQKFIIPGKASFILGDIGVAVRNLTHFKKKFDLILLDPPWANKSVKRKKKYWTIENEGLQKLFIPDLAQLDCLIAIWTTNNIDQNAFVTGTLFPAWSVKYCSTWHWIKVTQKGHPVIPFENVHKKPYENLVLGRFQPTLSEKSAIDISKKVFISVPSAIHSHKPPLQDILTPLLSTPDPACLELFARYLLPNWTSCGNEVLKLQHLDYYEIT